MDSCGFTRAENLSSACWTSTTNPKLGLGWVLILLARKNRVKFGSARLAHQVNQHRIGLTRFAKVKKKNPYLLYLPKDSNSQTLISFRFLQNPEFFSFSVLVVSLQRISSSTTILQALSCLRSSLSSSDLVILFFQICFPQK